MSAVSECNDGQVPLGRCCSIVSWLAWAAGWMAAAAAMVQILWWAYNIRLYAIKDYGPVIHEFDPWFNYRATEYLAERGWKAFFTWFDHMSWYPLGRPVATTIYPGMQVSAVVIWHVLHYTGRPWSLNDVCVYMPAWYGSGATLFTALLTYECSGGSGAAAVAGAAVMAILPAHARRSVGGGFDNESVAIPAMCATFYFWCRALRGPRSWPAGVAAGLAYAYLVASWGGYIFAINLIGVHAALLVAFGYHSSCLYRAYTLFFIIGTAGAVYVPVVSWTPLRSLEQLGPLAVFGAFQVLQLCKVLKIRKIGDSEYLTSLTICGAVAAAVVALLVPSGYFGPLSGRVRALLGHHATKTGNPLVDSVSEHQPSSPDAYWTNLQQAFYTAPVGLGIVMLPALRPRRAAFKGPSLSLREAVWIPSEAEVFLALQAFVACFFSLKMSRLILFIALPAAALSGVAIGCTFDWACSPFWRTLYGPSALERSYRVVALYNSVLVRLGRIALAAWLCYRAVPEAKDFYGACDNKIRYSLSHPQIMSKSSSGAIIDDYREAYWWLRDHTPEDSRIMAWWDYGYQIAGLANRTTIADGNTWNIEHIGLLGLCLSSPVSEAHRIARHLADYVLIWTGDGGSDIGKSTHFARISNSVYKGHCAEIDCDQFGVLRDGRPTRMMGDSLIWSLSGRGGRDGRTFENTDQFKEVYVSRNGRVRIVQVLQISEESKAWAANPSNRLCDAPGSWYCPGQYPPELRALFNESLAATSAEAAAYRREYRQRLQRNEEEKPKPNEAGLPDGSYLGSCRGCSLKAEGRQLVCTHCRLPGSPSVPSEITLPCASGKVDNIHGALHCKPLPNANDVLTGGYLKSCQGCQLEDAGALLRCSDCDTSSGHRQQAHIYLDECPRPGTLDNENGHLVCSGLPNADNIPDGTYKGSCNACILISEGSSLQCRCRAADASQRLSSMRVGDCKAPGVITNENGLLFCSGMPNGADIPAGGYRDSCQGCSLRGGVLRCTHCRAADGSQVESQLLVTACTPGRNIDNRDGILTC